VNWRLGAGLTSMPSLGAGAPTRKHRHKEEATMAAVTPRVMKSLINFISLLIKS
jgi:hypothetical protein